MSKTHLHLSFEETVHIEFGAAGHLGLGSTETLIGAAGPAYA